MVKALALYPDYEAAWKVISASQGRLGIKPPGGRGFMGGDRKSAPAR